MVDGFSRSFTPDSAIQVPFAISSNGKVSDTVSFEKIWEYRVKSALGTGLGERVLRPNYGVEISDIEFNTGSIAQEIIIREIEQVFVNYLPDLELSDVEPTFNPDTGTLNVSVSYILPNTTLSNVTVGVATIRGNAPISED